MRIRHSNCIPAGTVVVPLLAAALLILPVSGRAEIISSPAHGGPKTTIKYALWGGANEVIHSREICSAFVARYPDVAIDVAVYPWGQYWAKLQTQAAAGLAPDVMSLYSGNMGVWIARGALLALDNMVRESGMRLEDYYQSAIDNCTWNGRLFCMPIELPVRTLVYSKDRLEEAGIPEDRRPRSDSAMSWDEFKALADRLTVRRPDGSFAQYGMSAGIGWNEIMFRMYGGDFFDRQVNPTGQTVDGNTDLESGIVEIFSMQYGARNTLGAVPLSAGAFASGDTLLLSPKFAMGLTGPWALKALKDAGVRFGIAPMPRGPRPSQLIGVNAVGIYAHSRHTDAAWKFVSFMASDAVQPIFGRTLKGIPALISARDSLVHNDLGIEGCEAFLHDLPISAPMRMTANSYVPGALEKWLSRTEQSLDREYDRRLSRLRRTSDGIPAPEYEAFVLGMNGFVAQTVHGRLPELARDLDLAFKRGQQGRIGVMAGTVLPAAAAALLALLAALYVRWMLRSNQPDPVLRRRTDLAGYLFIAPWFVGFLCFVLGPIVAAVGLSFTEWNMISPPRWVGVANYISLAGDSLFFVGLKRTFLYVLLVVPISLCGGLFTAGLLTCDIRGRDAFKAIFYFPSLFTGAAVAVLWVNMFNKEYGVINRLLGFLHVPPVSWLDEAHAFYTVILMNVFWVGGAMIIYYAGMRQIPRSLYEAAEVDGAGAMRRFWSITIPMLSPVILFMVLMTTIGAFQVFTPALFFAPSSASIGAPGDALRFYSVNIYDEAFNNLRMGRACCYALILFVIIFSVTMIQMKVSKKYVHTEAS